MRRVLAVVVALSLVLSSPATAVAKTYPADCDDGSPSPSLNPRYWTERNWPGVPYNYYSGVLATLRYQDELRPCTQVLGGNLGFAAVFPANLDRLASGVGLVQFGMYRQDSSHSFQGEAVNATFFVMANNDDSSPQGLLATASSWAGYPTFGHSYHLQITSVSSGAAWQFKIIDLTTGGTHYSPNYTATFSNGRRAWYLYETLNGNSQLGSDDSAQQDLRVSNMKYLAGSTWAQHVPDNKHALDSVANYRHSYSASGTGSYWAYTIDN